MRTSLSLSPPTEDLEPTVAGWDAVISELAKFVRITDLSALEDSDNSMSGSDPGPAQLLTARRQATAAIQRAQVAVLRGQEALFQAKPSSGETGGTAVRVSNRSPSANIR